MVLLNEIIETSNFKLDKTICLFDLDGTLASHRQKASKEMLNMIESLHKICSIGIVSGGFETRIFEQTDGKNFDYIFSENGLVAYKHGELIHKESLNNFIDENELKSLTEFSKDYIDSLKWPFKKQTGHIDVCNCLINITPFGRKDLTAADRSFYEEYDKEHKIREKFIQALKQKFQNLNLTYNIGGQISFDITPAGFDKRFCLKQLEKDGYSTILFFGDKIFPGGNDYEIGIDPKTLSYHVNSPKETIDILKKLFKL